MAKILLTGGLGNLGTALVAADGSTGKAGLPYLLANGKDPAEIAAAARRAYSLLMRGVELAGERQRIEAVKAELARLGFQVRTPARPPTANVVYLYANISFKGSQDWDAVNSTLARFAEEALRPNGVKVVNVWVEVVREGPY